MPQIEAFREIGPYVDQPIRTYSTGMTALGLRGGDGDPAEILIATEALAVGRTPTSSTSASAIKEFQAAGTTLLFVSHDPVAVRTLCRRALLLDAGPLIQDGRRPRARHYNALIAKPGDESRDSCRPRRRRGGITNRSGTFEPTSAEVELLDAAGQPRAPSRWAIGDGSGPGSRSPAGGSPTVGS